MDRPVDPAAVSSRPAVSVILPVYNHASFAPAAIQSVLDQTSPPLELIIIDDGSTDGSAAACREFLRTAKRTEGTEISFHARDNKGAPETLNEGMRRAKGDYIAILNSDDLYLPSRLQECVDLLTREKARLLFTYVGPIDQAGAELPYDHAWRQWYYDAMMQELDAAPSISFLLLSKNIAVSTGNLVFHRSVISDVGAFAPYRYAHDLDFLLRYALIEEPLIFRKVLYKYRVHASNTISESSDVVAAEIVSVIRKYLTSCLAGECRNPLAPSFENWPAGFNDAIQMSPPLQSALDALLEAPAAPAPAAAVCQATPREVPFPAEITIVTHELSRTGAPMLVLELARSLKRLGLAVGVVSMKEGSLREEFVACGIPVKALDETGIARWLTAWGRLFQRVQRIPAVLGRLFPNWGNRLPAIPSRLAALSVRFGDLLVRLASAVAIPRLAANRHGILVINSFASFPLAFQLLSRWNGATFWYIHETYDPQALLRSGAARKRFDELYLAKRVRLLFGSEATRATWAQYGFDGLVRYWSGLPAAKANPLDQADRPHGSRPVVLSVGTNETRKGTRWLIEAFALARAKGWIAKDVELVIVGCRPPSRYSQARDLLARAWKSDLRGSVRLLSSVSPAVLDRYYRNADLYVQTSIMECLPLTLLTAMAHRLPIVTTDADGCREAIQDGENGRLIPSRRIEPLAAAMAELLNDRNKAHTFGHNAGRRFVEMFSLDATLGPLVAVLLNEDESSERRADGHKQTNAATSAPTN